MHRPIEQNKEPRNNACIHSQSISDKRASKTQCQNDCVFHKCYINACRRVKLDPSASPITKINTKWMKDLNVKPKILKCCSTWECVRTFWIRPQKHREKVQQKYINGINQTSAEQRKYSKE
jgi:hypothetical protein